MQRLQVLTTTTTTTTTTLNTIFQHMCTVKTDSVHHCCSSCPHTTLTECALLSEDKPVNNNNNNNNNIRQCQLWAESDANEWCCVCPTLGRRALRIASL